MRWRAFNPKEWHVRFARLPICIDGQAVWLEHYERRSVLRVLGELLRREGRRG